MAAESRDVAAAEPALALALAVAVWAAPMAQSLVHRRRMQRRALLKALERTSYKLLSVSEVNHGFVQSRGGIGTQATGRNQFRVGSQSAFAV